MTMDFLSKRAEERRQEFESHISDEIRALIQRGNVTLEELNGLRCNSWEWQALVPAMTDEAFVDRMQYALDNCHTSSKRPFSTYNEAVEGLWAPELLMRFKLLSIRLSAADHTALNLEETLDGVREVLGQKETHYLCIPDDVRIAIRALEWYATKSSEISTRAKLTLATIRNQATQTRCESCHMDLCVLDDDRVPAIFCAECGGGCVALPAKEVIGE